MSRRLTVQTVLLVILSAPRANAQVISELGGAIVLPADVVDDPDGVLIDGGGGFTFSPLPYDGPNGEERAGWNAHRHLFGAVIGVARARVEYEPLVEMILGAQLDVPIAVELDGDVNIFPQGSIEIAYRSTEGLQAGIRTRLSSYAEPPLPNPDRASSNPRHELGVSFEPFVRLALLEREIGGFVRVALVVPVGPAYPILGERGAFFPPRGYLGGELALGALY